MKNPFKLKAKVTFIGQIETFQRKGKTDLSKQVIGLETEDGHILYPEVRKNNFDKCAFLRVGHEVEIEYVFSGTEKNGKQYNNIIIYEINILS